MLAGRAFFLKQNIFLFSWRVAQMASCTRRDIPAVFRGLATMTRMALEAKKIAVLPRGSLSRQRILKD